MDRNLQLGVKVESWIFCGFKNLCPLAYVTGEIRRKKNYLIKITFKHFIRGLHLHIKIASEMATHDKVKRNINSYICSQFTFVRLTSLVSTYH